MYIVGGYLLDIETAHMWFTHRSRKPPSAYLMPKALDRALTCVQAHHALKAVATDFPKGTWGNPRSFAIVLVWHDSNILPWMYQDLTEGDDDQCVRDWLQKQGLDLPWVTIPDPFMEEAL